MTIPWRTIFRLLPILTATILMLSGCASFFQGIDEKVQRNKYRSDYENLDRAIAVYDEGDYRTALSRFKELASTSNSQLVRKKAGLGAICCDLVLARSANDHNRAIAKWHEFAASVTPADNAWEPVLLDPLFLQRCPVAPPDQATPQKKATTDTTVPEISEVHPPASTALPSAKAQKELDGLKKRAERADALERQLNDAITENQSLKEKIKALEAIDQNIQKKKTAIAEPGE